MRYPLDTNIVSELMKTAPHPGVVTWVNECDADSVLMRGESSATIQLDLASRSPVS